MRGDSRMVWSLAALSILLFPVDGLGGQSADRLSHALTEMHDWVGDDDNGRRWKQFLKSEDLQAQLSQGSTASRSKVTDILNIYAGDTPGLQHRRFASVRQALRNWLAELPDKPRELSQAASAEKDRFVPVDDSGVGEKKAALQSALVRLDRYLDSGDRENAKRWKQYLKLPDLKSELATEEPPKLSNLQNVLNAFYAEHEGLELPEFTGLRESLRAYMNAVLFRHQPGVEELFARRVEALAGHLDDYQNSRETADAVAIGRIVGWLESGNQTPQLVRQVRQRYWQPNLYGYASQKLMAAGVSDVIDELQNVNENILGTSLHGVARMRGQVGVRLVPAKEVASFDIEMSGVAAGNNVGYNGPVTICSYGETQVFSQKRVYLDDRGLTSAYAQARCSTNSTINSIAARSELIRKIAWRRAGRLKPQSESIAARRAEVRVSRRMDAQTASMLTEANQQFDERARKPLLRWNAYPRQVQFQTDHDHLQVQVLHATPYQIAAPEPPPTDHRRQDFGVQLHESIVANFAESLLGGRTLTDERLVDLLTEAGAEVPEELEISDDKDPWSISFSSDQPVSAKFREGRVRIGVRGRRFTRGEQEVRNTIEISASYQLETMATGTRLTREGDVVVEYVPQRRLSISEVAMKTFLARKFDALFKQEIVTEGLSLPGRWQRAGTLFLDQIASQNQWLSLGWKIPEEPTRMVSVVDLVKK